MRIKEAGRTEGGRKTGVRKLDWKASVIVQMQGSAFFPYPEFHRRQNLRQSLMYFYIIGGKLWGRGAGVR